MCGIQVPSSVFEHRRKGKYGLHTVVGLARQVYCRQECLNSQIKEVPKCIY